MKVPSSTLGGGSARKLSFWLIEIMKRSLRIERLTRKEEKATIRRIVYLSFVSLVLGVIFFALGIPFLGKFADFVGGIFRRDLVQEAGAPQAPILDELPTATNSARLPIRGFSSDGKKVEIYHNGDKVGEVDVSDNHFSYDGFRLKDGENEIYAKALSEASKTSDSSQTKKVIYSTKEPKLEIESPSEGQNFVGNNRIRVSGQTDPDAQVYANGFLASISGEGKFEVFVPVGEGETTIEIKAQDSAGNEKIEKRKINYHK
ncbi:hypothetical protein A2870_02900 [Candidatus Curtissbacteria bacterium RIFCSPHIGHO2_01_FULL_41_11]|uniref:Bacterial Ig domain-containing protein n=1 Tax=Candidatus Curtissbacteria bacterium RIFCSPHIGHO2_01_FULL_41_11 TaxID=1797711 RepID=A0A1F5G700_9BACT|nr:MAG: hypothetical protein A2870_02900 [Candidatus Curtissbacteria bacterium RIFCSPHIGHO2_01_FULL_41_11]